MRLYDTKRFDRGLSRRFRSHSWGRDAIVWDIDEVNFIMRCKIQGSNELILCHYPRNWQTLPPWCKRGNAVRIAHKGGVKGYMEVLGHGRAIPTPVAGTQLPESEPLFDTILTGGETLPYAGMTIEVTDMTFRINETIYGLAGDDPVMDAGGSLTMDDPPPVGMGEGNKYITLDAAPAVGSARYDLLVVGTDGEIDVIKGTAASTSLVMPSVPANHVKVCHVLVLGGSTEITSSMINALWEEKVIAGLQFDVSNGTGTINANDEFVWHLTNMTPYCQFTATVIDQYGWDYNPSGNTEFVFQLMYGTGGIAYPLNGDYGSATVIRTVSGTNAYIYYKRDETLTEYSPLIMVSLTGLSASSSYRIQLLDGSGAPLP